MECPYCLEDVNEEDGPRPGGWTEYVQRTRIPVWIVKVGEPLEIVGLKPTLQTVCTGVEMLQAAGPGSGWGQRRGAAAGHEA